MKYLQDYMESAQTKLFADTGTIFAYSKKQYDAQAKAGVTYVNLGSGILCPEGNEEALAEGLKSIHVNAIAQDLAENGKEAIIERELHNHEAFYTGRLSDTVDALEGYEITREEIRHVYNRVAPTVDC